MRLEKGNVFLFIVGNITMPARKRMRGSSDCSNPRLKSVGGFRIYYLIFGMI